MGTTVGRHTEYMETQIDKCVRQGGDRSVGQCKPHKGTYIVPIYSHIGTISHITVILTRGLCYTMSMRVRERARARARARAYMSVIV